MRVDEIQAGRFGALDLSAQQKVNVEGILVPLKRLSIDVRNPTHAIPYDAGCAVERVRLSEAAARVEVAAEEGDYGLADGEATTRQDHEHPLARLYKAVHFSAHIYLVKSSIGPRIRGHYEPLVCHDPQTVSHRSSRSIPLRLLCSNPDCVLVRPVTRVG